MQFTLYLDSDDIRVLCKADGSFYWYWTSAADVTDDMIGNWTHLVFVHDGTSMKVYKNGSDITADGTWGISTDKTKWFKSVMTDATDKADNFYIGARNGNSTVSYWLDGKVDDFRLYSTDLTYGEISTLYNAGNGTEASLSGGGGITGQMILITS